MSKSVSSTVQALIQSCEKYASAVALKDPSLLTLDAVAPVAAALQHVSAADLNLTEPQHWRVHRPSKGLAYNPTAYRESKTSGACQGLLSGRPPAVYFHAVAETELYQVCVFVLPPGGFIPIHDHPNMCVVTKVLYGQIHLWSCDWEDSNNACKLAERGGPVQVVDDFVSCKKDTVKTLLPRSGGNLHEFFCPEATDSEAERGEGPVGAAILDVIMPPYNEEKGRLCSYFEKVLPKREGDKVSLRFADFPDFNVETLH